MDALESINVQGDSTYMLMLEACLRGHAVAYCQPKDLFVENGRAFASVQTVRVQNKAPYFYDIEASRRVDLEQFQVVWMRKDPPFDMDYIFSTYILEQVPATTMVVNRPSSIRTANEKMFAMWWPEFCPPTLVTCEIEHARAWAKNHERVVIKPWDGNGGRGVLVSQHNDPNFRSMLELLTEEEQTYILVQKYIPEIRQGDKRIILVNGEAVGWMDRVPQAGDHRGNMHVGATVAACELEPRDKEICQKIAPTLIDMGLIFVGIDIIGEYLTEINVTSPTGIQEINPMMNIQIEKIITNCIEKEYRNHIQR